MSQDGTGLVSIRVAECLVGGSCQGARTLIAIMGVFGHATLDHRVKSVGHAQTLGLSYHRPVMRKPLNTKKTATPFDRWTSSRPRLDAGQIGRDRSAQENCNAAPPVERRSALHCVRRYGWMIDRMNRMIDCSPIWRANCRVR